MGIEWLESLGWGTVNIVDFFGLFGIFPNGQRLAVESSEDNIEAVCFVDRLRRGKTATAGCVPLHWACVRRKRHKRYFVAITPILRTVRIAARSSRISHCLTGAGYGG